jgi:hypothetical protein
MEMMMGGLPGGMAGQPDAPDAPRHFQLDTWLLVVSPEGDRVTMHDTATGQTRPLRLGEPGQGTVEISPVARGYTVALSQQGPKITKTAVFDMGTGVWYQVDLKKPVESVSPTTTGSDDVYIALGEQVHVFNAAKKRWATLDLPEGSSEYTLNDRNGILTIEAKNHIYSYIFQDGRWKDLDTRKLLDAPESDGARPGAVKP